MLKAESPSRIHLIAQARGAGAEPADPAIRRFRLARLRLESRSAELVRSAQTQRV